MKKLKILMAGAIGLCLVLLSTSCMSTAEYESRLAKKISDSLTDEYADLTPENSVLLFGAGYCSITLLQQNPDLGVKILPTEGVNASSVGGEYIVSYPIALGSEIKVYETLRWYKGDRYFINRGIGGVDYIVEKPGLLYLDMNDPEHLNEFKSLKYLLICYEGTVWESTIKARLEELEK